METNNIKIMDNIISSNSVFDVIKSESDDREYKFCVLQNKMKILLVSDSSTEKSAASLYVHVGSSRDPVTIPGIAHFCEHMLFLGTQKYPEEEDYNTFLSQNGGSSNACTLKEYTNYYFDVKAEALLPALDRFAQFFLHPLFNIDSTERELHAIDSEHQKNILNDTWREHFISCSTAKPGHVFQKFSTGNLRTLKTRPEEEGVDVRDLLLEFHKNYYSSNIMTLAIIGKETIDELEKMCLPLFENVTNRDVEIPVETCPYGNDELCVVVKIPTIMEIKDLELSFMIPDVSEHWTIKPWDYIEHLIGHEGEGSLLSLLKKKVWVNSLFAYCKDGMTGFDFFSISMSLTDDGLNHIFDVIDICFQYIHMLKEEGPQLRIFKEIRMLNEMNFRFKNKIDAMSYVLSKSYAMHFYPAKDVLYGGYRMDSFEPDLITKSLGYLNPTNFRCTVQSKIFEGKTDKIVPYYDAGYCIEKIPDNQIEKWKNIGLHPELHLPKENLFVAENLNIVVPREIKETKGKPVLIKDDQRIRVWFKADDTFFLPKSFLKIHISSPFSFMTPSHVNHLSMYNRLIQDELVEFGYDAELAGIRYDVDYDDTGLSIDISGYNCKQLVLLRKILEHVTDLDVKEERFNVNKIDLEEDLKNGELSEPYQRVNGLKCYLTYEKSWNLEERLDCLDILNVESLKWFITEFLRHVYIECLLCGNMLLDNANEIWNTVKTFFNVGTAMLPTQHMLLREYKLSTKSTSLFEKRSKIHASSCVYVYYQVGMQEKRYNVLCELFCQMIEAPFFDTLRTKEQLGYVVASGIVRSDSVQGIKAVIQTEKTPDFVHDKIEEFFDSFEETIKTMSETQFNDYVEALAVEKLEKPKRLNEECHNFWGEISCKQYFFDRSDLEVEELRSLTIDDVMQFYQKYISATSNKRRKMVVVILGKDAESLAVKKKTWDVIDDVLMFKARLPLYPHVVPFNNVSLLSNPKT